MISFLDIAQDIWTPHDVVCDLYTRFKSATNKAEKRAMADHSDAEELSVCKKCVSLGPGNAAEHNKGEWHV